MIVLRIQLVKEELVLFKQIIDITLAFLCFLFLALGVCMLNTVIGLILPYVISIPHMSLMSKIALAIFIPISAITFATEYLVTLYNVFLTLGYNNLYVRKLNYGIVSIFEYFKSYSLPTRERLIGSFILLQLLGWFYALS